MDGLKIQGAQAVLLGCTEFPILLNNIDACLPKIDSAMCHLNDIKIIHLTVGVIVSALDAKADKG